MDPKLLPSQCVIVVSPVGKIYLIDAFKKIVLWSYVIPKDYLDNKIYEAIQKGRVSNYLDVHVDEFGEIRLYRYNSSEPPKAIPLISCDQVRTDITYYFGDRVTSIINVNRFNLDYEHGKRVKIKKTDYEFITSEWRLRFSKYQARVIFNDNCSLPIHVYHTHELEAFSHFCCTTMRVVDESLNYDIWRIQNMTFQNYSSERNSFIVSVPKTFLIPSEVRTFLSSNNDKFLILHGVKSDEKYYNLLFEHWEYTLYEHIHKVEIGKRRPIIRDLVDAIMFLHLQNICHTKLDPWNVVFTKNSKLKITGFRLKPSTEKLVDEDLRALGKLIAFCYSDPINPNGCFTVEDYAKLNIQTSQSTWACEARDIADQLQFEERPPSLDEVSLHPFLRSSEKHIQFCMDATALLEQKTDSNRNLRNEMQKVWKSGVPLEIEDSPEEVFYDTKSSSERITKLMDLVGNLKKLRFLPVLMFGKCFEDYLPSILDLFIPSILDLSIPEALTNLPISVRLRKRHLLDLSIGLLTMGLLSDILSLTSPVDVCRAAVVSKIFKAVADSDYVWHKFLPLDLHEIIARAVSNVVFHSQKELYFLLSDSYILLDRGTLAFKLDKESGKKCYMLAARHLSIAWQDDKRYWEWGHIPESRFAEVGMLKEVWCLDIHGIITTAMLSPKTMYVAYLVFLTTRWSSGLNVPAKTIVTVGGIRNETSNVYLQRPGTSAQPQVAHTMRKDGWMEIPLGEFYCDDGDEGEVEMVFEEHVYWKAGLIVEGMEVRPK